MKNIKKLLALLLCAASVALFFSCAANTEDDEELVVTISADGTDSSTSRKITMTYPSNYDGKKVYIAYTLDGSTPDVSYDSNKYSATAEVTEYFDYGTASLYEGAFSLSESATITAKAFYVNGNKAALGPVATKTVTVKSSIDTSSSTSEAAPVSGDYEFKLASSGNSLFTHYFDTSSGTLFKWGDYEHCYYQIQFSYTKASAGNWYLFVRQVGNATPIKGSDGNTNFVAKGTYTGDCFNARKADSVTDGSLTLTNTVGSKEYSGVYTVSNNALTMKVSGDSSSSVYVGDAK
ncbi:MAG: hypothetical protein K5873_03285 [Treponema sp.]|nr:hypothetical protein [Treponema sp.]